MNAPNFDSAQRSNSHERRETRMHLTCASGSSVCGTQCTLTQGVGAQGTNAPCFDSALKQQPREMRFNSTAKQQP